MIWAALQQQILTAFQGTNLLLPNQVTAIFPLPLLATDWPPVQSLAGVASGAIPTIISIFDKGGERNNTTAIPLFYALPPTLGTPGAVLTLNTPFLPAGETITLTGSGVPLVNDAFCLTLAAGTDDQFQLFANYTALVTDTLVNALDGMVTQINLLTGIVASRTGNVITVTNSNPASYDVWSEVVNVGSFTQEGFRWDRDIQVTVWSRTPADRSKYGNILEQLFSQMEVNYGFFTTDNSACRVQMTDFHIWKDSQLQDIYRYDFMLQLNYPVLNTIPGFLIETIPQGFASPVPTD